MTMSPKHFGHICVGLNYIVMISSVVQKGYVKYSTWGNVRIVNRNHNVQLLSCVYAKEKYTNLSLFNY